MSTSSLEIVLGASWKDDARYVTRLCAYRPEDEAFDFGAIRDIIDIVVDGANLTSSLPEDCIFHVVHDLVHGLAMISEGRVHKHIVAFHEAPWELAIQAVEDRLQVSLYGVGSQVAVSVHNVDVKRDKFVDAVCRSAEQLISDLVGLNEAFAKADLVLALSERVQRSQMGHSGASQAELAGAGVPHGAGLVARRVGDRRLSAQVSFDGAHPDFWRYQGALDSDWHSLLFRGDLTLGYWGRQRCLAQGAYLFPLMGALVRGAEQLLDLNREGRQAAVLLDGADGARCLVTVERTRDDQWALRVREPNGSTGQTQTQLEQVQDLWVSLSETVLEAIVDLNPRQALNHRVTELKARISRVRGRLAELRRGNQYFDDVDAFLKVVPEVRPVTARLAQKGAMPWPIADVRHLFLRQRWMLIRNQLELARMTSIHGRLIVPSRVRVDAVDPSSGASIWGRNGTLVASTDDAVIATLDGSLTSRDADDGALRWELDLAAEVGTLQVFTAGARTLAAGSVGEHHIHAIDLESGAVAWTHRLHHGELVGCALAGPILAVVTDDGFTQGLSPTDGQVMWKIRTPGCCVVPPVFHQGRLFVCADGDPGFEGVLYCLYPLTGRKVFEVRTPASFARTPLMVGSLGLLPLEYPGGAALLALDLESGEELWSHQIETAQVDAPSLTWPDPQGGLPIVVKTDTGRCLGLDPKSGDTVWTTDLLEPGEVLLANLPPAEVDGHLVVPERFVSTLDPRSGVRLHRLDGLPEHPTFLHVDRDLRLLLGEGDSHLECYDLGGFLALV